MEQEHINALAEARRDTVVESSLLEMAQQDAWRLNEVELLIEDYAKQIEMLREEREELRSKKLPGLMMQASAPIISFHNIICRLKSVVQGNLPSVSESKKLDDAQRSDNLSKREWIFKWLAAHGHSGIVRRTVTIDLPRGSDTVLYKLLDAIATLKLRAEVKEDVHWQTYQKFCRELCADETQLDKLPLEKLCIFIGLIAEIVR